MIQTVTTEYQDQQRKRPFALHSTKAQPLNSSRSFVAIVSPLLLFFTHCPTPFTDWLIADKLTD